MPAYDSVSFDPPAPVARVLLRNLRTGGSSREIPAVLDTGADITLIPQSAAAEIGVLAVAEASYELAGFDGRVSRVQSAELDVLFLGKAIRGRYLLYDRDYGILGRDVLNLVSLLMDGPRQVWSGRFGPAEV